MTIAKTCVGLSLVFGLCLGLIGCGDNDKDDDDDDTYGSELSKAQKQEIRDAVSRLDTALKSLKAAECPCLSDMDGQVCKQIPGSCYLNEDECVADHEKAYGADPPIDCLFATPVEYFQETIDFAHCRAEALEQYVACLSAREPGCGTEPTVACVNKLNKQGEECPLSDDAATNWNACW